MINSEKAITLQPVYISIILSNVESSTKWQMLCLPTSVNKVEKTTLFNSLTHTQVVLNNIFLKIINRMKNKDPCYGLRLLYLRI